MNTQLFSTKVASKSRDYFFDVKQSKNGNYYLAINESRKSEEGVNTRQCVLIFNNLLSDFASAFAKSMQEISQLDKNIVWDPRNVSGNLQAPDNSKQSETTFNRRRYRDMTAEDIENEQAINLKNGKPKNFGLRWNEIDRQEVKQLHIKGETIALIAKTLHRSIPSINAELTKQGLIQDNSTLEKPF